jgi:hypothetical protein
MSTLVLLRSCFNNQGKYSPHIIFFVTFYGCNLQVKPELGFQLFKDAIHLCCYEAKLTSLKLKTRPKQIYSYLPGESRRVVQIMPTLILLWSCFNNQFHAILV